MGLTLATINFLMRPVVWLVVLAACGGRPSVREPDAPDTIERRPPDSQRRYTIWLGGAQVGTAAETERWSAAGVALRRTEALRFLRGDQEVALTTAIEIDASLALVPTRVRWTESGLGSRTVEATHDATGWHLTLGEARALPTTAIPAELVPLVVRRDGAFRGPVFLPARGFVAGTGRVEPVAPRRLVARLDLDAGPIVEATIDLGSDGAPLRVVDGEGVIARRATDAQATADFPLVDLIAATSVPLTGAPSSRLALLGDLAVPAVPGQAPVAATAGLGLELSPALPGDLPAGDAGPDRTRDIRALVAAVRARIAPDLRAGSVRAHDVATAGDCTTFALAYSALAARTGIPTHVVTGLRVDGRALVRHRWAVSWTGRAWIAVDAAFGAAPAGGDLIGLAIHGADDAGLIAGEAALTRVRGATWL